MNHLGSTYAIPAEIDLDTVPGGSVKHKDIPSHKTLAFSFYQWGQYLNLIWYFKVSIKSKRPSSTLSLKWFRCECGLKLKSASLEKVDYLCLISSLILMEITFCLFLIYFSDGKEFYLLNYWILFIFLLFIYF